MHETGRNQVPLVGEASDRLRALPDSAYRALTDELPHMVWSTRPDGFHDYYNRRWYEFTGMPFGSTDGEAWNEMVHPDDRARAWKIWRESLESGKPYEVEYRLRHHSGEYRWTLGLAMPIRNDDGTIVRWVGTCTDIHERKLLYERNKLLNLELSHRIKNIFSVVTALIRLSATSQPEHGKFADVVRERINALGRAHEFVRPHSEYSRLVSGEPTFFGMLDQIFAGYPAYRDRRLTLSGDDILIDDQAATPLALVFHELATNAFKYGALQNPQGRIALSSTLNGDQVEMIWEESGMVDAPTPSETKGFGHQLIEISIVHQLGGAYQFDWRPDGLMIRFYLPVDRIHR